MAERQHLIHFHGSSREDLERQIASGKVDIEPGELVVATGKDEPKDE